MPAQPRVRLSCARGFQRPGRSWSATSRASPPRARSPSRSTRSARTTPSFTTPLSGYQEPRRVETVDGLAHVFAINVLAPYLLTALIRRPERLVYLSSGLHRSGDAELTDLQWLKRGWDGSQAYADSKLFDVVLAFAVARLWPHVRSNALEPGWVAEARARATTSRSGRSPRSGWHQATSTMRR